MNRDIALKIVQKLTNIQTATEHIANGAENQSSLVNLNLNREFNYSTEKSQEPEEIPEEPVTKRSKK